MKSSSLMLFLIFSVCLLCLNAEVATACCKVCSAGKACGNSCISKAYTCHKAPGCACNRESPAPRATATPIPRKPKLTQTSNSIAPPTVLSNQNSVLCAYVASAHRWQPGRFLPSGKFLLLSTEISNVAYLASYSRGSQAESWRRLEKKLKRRLSAQRSICSAIAAP